MITDDGETITKMIGKTVSLITQFGKFVGVLKEGDSVEAWTVMGRPFCVEDVSDIRGTEIYANI